MRLEKFYLILLIIFSVSCSGPQMVSTPTAPETVVIEKKKTGQSNNEAESKKLIPDDQGVFDDQNFALKTDLKQWKLIDDSDGVKTYEKILSNSGLVAFRGETLIPASMKKVATVLVDANLQKDWVDSFVEMKIISEKNELDHIQYNQTKVPWPFQNRDFLFRVIARIDPHQPATALVNMKSVEDPLMPPVSGVVRGEIVHSYYYFKETTGFLATKMVVEMEVDPKGAIPLWLVNLSQKNWPHNTLAAVKKLSLREDIPVLTKLDKYFEVAKTVKIVKKGKKK